MADKIDGIKITSTLLMHAIPSNPSPKMLEHVAKQIIKDAHDIESMISNLILHQSNQPIGCAL